MPNPTENVNLILLMQNEVSLTNKTTKQLGLDTSTPSLLHPLPPFTIIFIKYYYLEKLSEII